MCSSSCFRACGPVTHPSLHITLAALFLCLQLCVCMSLGANLQECDCVKGCQSRGRSAGATLTLTWTDLLTDTEKKNTWQHFTHIIYMQWGEKSEWKLNQYVCYVCLCIFMASDKNNFPLYIENWNCSIFICCINCSTPPLVLPAL